MPPLTGILETALYVADLDRSVQFYQAVFGFEVIDSGPRLYALGVAGKQVLLLCKKGAAANLGARAHDGGGRLHLAFAIAATDFDAWEAWLPQHGLAIVEKRIWERGGRSLYFRDPDEHLLELATPGTWSVY